MKKTIFLIAMVLMSMSSRAEVQSSITLAIDYSGSYVANRKSI